MSPKNSKSSDKTKKKKKGKKGSGYWDSPWSAVPIFAVSLLLHLIHLRQMARFLHFQTPVLDAAFFDQWAQKIAAGQAPADVFFVDPLYPYFLGALYRIFGHDLDAVRLVQALIGAGSAVLIQRLGMRLLGGPAGFLCGMLAACYRPFIYYDALLLKPVLVVPFTTLFLYFSVGVLKYGRRLEALWAGLFLGLTILVRGNFLILVPVAALAFILSGKLKGVSRQVAAALLVTGAALVVAPVTLHNHRAGGEWILTTSGMGQNLYIGNHPDNTTGSYVGAPFTRPNALYEELDFRTEAEKRTGRSMTPAELSRFWTSATLRVIADDPWRFIVHEGKKIWLLTHAVEIPDNYSFDFERRFSWVLRLPFPAFGILFPLAIVGMLAGWREKKNPALRFLILFSLVYAVSLLPFFIISRFRIPLIPAFIVLGVSGVMAMARAFREMEWKPAALYLALAVGIAAYAHPAPGWIPMAEIHFNFGTQFQERKLYAEAEEQFREAIRLDPKYAWAYNNLGTVLATVGRTEEANRMFAEAARLDPKYWEAEYNRADMAVRAGRAEEAGPILERLLAERPDSYEATLLSGLVERRRGNTEDALTLYRRAGRLRPEAVEAPYNEAMLLNDLGRVDEAREVLLRLAERHPDHEPTGRALRALGSP